MDMNGVNLFICYCNIETVALFTCLILSNISSGVSSKSYNFATYVAFSSSLSLSIYIYNMNQYKKYVETVCLYKWESKNLKWLNKQVKRVLRSDTRPVSRLYDFQVWLQCWRYHYYLLIWRCLSNYGVRYLCAYIKSHRSDVSSVNAVKATLAVIYLCLLFSVDLNFSIKYVSYDWLS